MKLPNSKQAIVDTTKVAEYFLSLRNPVGGAKARWFSQMGYSTENAELLHADLLAFADNDAIHIEANGYGDKYKIIGNIQGPTGGPRPLVTIWIILNNEIIPRLVTAYPGE